MMGRPQNVVVQPELADDDEADQPAQELGEQTKQLMAHFAHAAMIVQRGDFEVEDKQCDDYREYPVAECLNPVEAQFSWRKSLSLMATYICSCLEITLILSLLNRTRCLSTIELYKNLIPGF